MNPISITSTDSFIQRAQRSELTRAILWTAVLLVMAGVTLLRRLNRGAIMSENTIFYPYIGIIVMALGLQAALMTVLVRANRRGDRLSDWMWRGSAALDLGVAVALLVVAAIWSPRGAIPALTSPVLLLMPLVVLLSILRLRPVFTLVMGLVGAGVHAALAMRALSATQEAPEWDPVYMTYSVVLAITAVAAMFVARQVRSHVIEAAAEATGRERADRELVGMQRDLAVARDIQAGLLPTKPPSLAGFDITGMNRPADQTGGDYYDWQTLSDGRVAVVLADVTGHGIGPALVMAVCRAYARAAAPSTPDPAALLTRLNVLLHDDLPSDRFITLVLGVLSEDGVVQLISAGHGPTLLYRASNGKIEQFGGDGIPLGIAEDERYGPTTSLRLSEGDVLVMLTDGFHEWARPGDGQSFGIPRIQEVICEHACGSAADILGSIDQAVRKFCDGATQSDDMTAIVIKRTV